MKTEDRNFLGEKSLHAGRKTLRPVEARPCSVEWRVYRCGCQGATAVRWGCERVDCRECRGSVSKRRAAAAWERFQHRPRGSAVVYTVFTVPPRLRARMKIPGNWDELRRRAWAMLKRKFGALYGCEASHPFGENPKRDGFHPHLNFLWVPGPQGSPFVDVARLRAAWASLLDTGLAVDVYSQYSREVGKIRHWARYVTRPWCGFSWWCGNVKWYGPRAFINRKSDDGETWKCETCKTEYKYLGKIEGLSGFLYERCRDYFGVEIGKIIDRGKFAGNLAGSG